MTAVQQAEVLQVAAVGAGLAVVVAAFWAAGRVQQTQPLNRAAALLAWPLSHWVRTYADIQLADDAARLAAEAAQAADPAEADHLRAAARILTCTGEHR